MLGAIIGDIVGSRFEWHNIDVWDRTSYAIVKRGVRAKFEQNKDILQVLLDTQDNVLAECSLIDKKWGIGVAIDNPDCSDPSKWNGKNYLGRILMEVRDELRRLSAAGKIG
ncbi:MAG: NADAR family protein [Candidatus Ventricola sp.]|nr:NADAR family protein [Candidatus Ventricola sp.]